jgi:hypothetical protein
MGPHRESSAGVGEGVAGSQEVGVGSAMGVASAGMTSADGAAPLPAGVAPRCGSMAAATAVSGTREQQG